MSGVEITNDDYRELGALIDFGVEPSAAAATKFGFLRWVFVSPLGLLVTDEARQFRAESDRDFLLAAFA